MLAPLAVVPVLPAHFDDSNNWGYERWIRAGQIRCLCINAAEDKLIDSRGPMVAGAKIDGKPRLSHVTIPLPFSFV